MNVLLTKMSDLLILIVLNLEANDHIDADKFTTIWRLVRTECGLPTSITKQENVDGTDLEEARESLDNKLKKHAKPATTKKRKRPAKKKPKPKTKPKS